MQVAQTNRAGHDFSSYVSQKMKVDTTIIKLCRKKLRIFINNNIGTLLNIWGHCMLVSAIVCSRFERASIRKTIEKLLEQTISEPYSFEVIVVNNNSLPNELWLEQNKIHDSRLVFAWEKKPGHSCALNKAISISRGELLLFIDDDAMPCPGWAQSYVDACTNETGYMFGPISTNWSTLSDELLPRSLRGFSFGEENIDFRFATSTSYPVGVNMALTREALDRGLLFNERLGPGSCLGLPFGADVLIGKEALSRGLIGKYVGKAKVFHEVPEERVRFTNLVKRKYQIGKSAYCYDWKPISFQKLLFTVTWEVVKMFWFMWYDAIEARKSILKIARSIGLFKSKIAHTRLVK